MPDVLKWPIMPPSREEKDIYQPLSFHPGLPRRLKWTKEKPTEPGWYWNRRNYPDKKYVSFFKIWKIDDDRIYADSPQYDCDAENEWAGPIPEPMEAEQ